MKYFVSTASKKDLVKRGVNTAGRPFMLWKTVHVRKGGGGGTSKGSVKGKKEKNNRPERGGSGLHSGTLLNGAERKDKTGRLGMETGSLAESESTF